MINYNKEIQNAIQQHSTEIDLLNIAILEDAELLYLIENCPTLTKISLARADPFVFDCLMKLPNLKSLTINDWNINKAGMEKIFKLKNLLQLGLEMFDDFPEDFFKELPNHLSGLRSFSSIDSEFYDEDLLELSRLKHLNSLTLQRTNISSGWKYLTYFKSLSCLQIAYDDVNFEGLEDFIPQLEKFILNNCYVKELYLGINSIA